MKRYSHIFIFATIILGVVGCEKFDLESAQSDLEQLITFVTDVEATRAAETDLTALQDYGKFNIAAFVKEGSDDYMHYYSEEVSYSANASQWYSGVNRYWPVGDGRTLDFFAYSPIDKDFVEINEPTNYDDYSLTYTCPVDIDDQIDMLAVTLADQSYTAATASGNVALDFQHILSSIRFKVEIEAECNVTLDNISINYIGIEKKRTYNFALEGWETPESKIYFINDDVGCTTTLEVGQTETLDTSNGSSVVFDNIDNRLMIIPQEIVAEKDNQHYISIQIFYTLNSVDEAVTAVTTGVMPLPAPNTESLYNAGELYTYSVIVNGEQMSFGEVTIADQEEPEYAYGNIDLGLITEGISLSEYNAAIEGSATKTTDEGSHLYYATALRAYLLLEDGVRDFVLVGDYGADDSSNDGKLGYHGSESSPFFIAAESLGMMPDYQEVTDVNDNKTKSFETDKNDDGSYSITGVDTKNLFSIDLRGVYDFPTFTHLSVENNLLDEGAEMIPSYAFRDLALLDEVIFPAGLQAIGDYAFENCVSLRTVDLAGVVHIEEGGFADCINLETVNGDEGALTRIHAYGFDSCENLTTIDLQNVAEVDEFGFVNCYKLNNINLSSLKTIGMHAFDGCSSLTLEADSSNPAFSYVADYAFSGCEKLGENGVKIDLTAATGVGNHAFNECTQIILSSGALSLLETVGYNAFTNCAQIGSTYEVSLPKIVSIGACAFQGCTKLNIVEGLENLEVIEISAFQECPSLTGYLSTATSDSEKILSLPLVESVGNFAFTDCESLTNISFGADGKLTSIGNFAFNDCTSLTTITGLESVESVGTYAFAGSSSISALDLSSATSVGAEFISGCSNLQSFIMPLVVDDSFVDEDETDSFTPTNISTMLKSVSTNLETINVESLEIESFPSWTSWAENSVLKTVNIAACLELEEAAFANCTALAEVIASSAETVGDHAFNGCIELQTVDLSSATSLGSSVFSGCTELQTLNLASLATSLGGWCFNGYESLESVDISSAPTIEAGTFYQCTNLTSVDASSATSVGVQAFGNCANLSVLDLRGVTQTPPDYADDSLYLYPFYGATTTNCTLYLNQAQYDSYVTDGVVWYNTTWKEIIVM